VQYNNAIGPYKGGLRFHPGVSLDTFKFLGFEQTFKNALTGLYMGGGKGGSDFNSKGRSEADIMSFCHAFMLELYKHIGPDTDVPAGDIGVGSREIGFMQGMYKKLTDHVDGSLTGKSPAFGGSLMRKEATGFGAVYFLDNALNHANDGLKDKRCLVSGAGNVALHAAMKLHEKGAKVLTLSDSNGVIYFKDGMTEEQIQAIYDIKENKHGSLKQYHEESGNGEYRDGGEPWDFNADIAIPCATQNEVDEKEAHTLSGNGVKWVCEGANMPTTAKAFHHFRNAGIILLPAKAANAGGVSVSGLERTQNATYQKWSAEKVDEELKQIMVAIHKLCLDHIPDGQKDNYAQGANIAGFKVVAQAMMAYRTL